MKKDKKKRIKRFLLTIFLIIILIIVLFFIINNILRKEVSISNNQIENLNKIFPNEHINNIKLYKGGLFSIGSTKVICKSIYFENSDLGTYFFEDQDSNESLVLLVHETTHTYQARTPIKCIKMTFSSLYNQFFAYLKHGSRNFAYYYNISEENYNPEQEASIIEDYFFLKLMNGNIIQTSCYDCDVYEKEELVNILEIKKSKILEKYN